MGAFRDNGRRWPTVIALVMTWASAPEVGVAAEGITRLRLPEGVKEEVVRAERGGDLLFVRLKIDGKDAGWFIADTGATHITIDSPLADELKLEVLGRAEAKGVGGSRRVTFRRADSIEIGRALLKTGRIVAADLSSFSAELGRKLSGLLGYDAWSQLPFSLDYQAKTITFYARERFTSPAGGKVVGLRISNRQPTVSATIEEKYRGRLMLDSGHEGALYMAARYLARHPDLAKGRRFSSGTAVGLGGDEPSQYAAVNRLEILGRTFRNVRTGFPPFKADPKSRPSRMGILGGGYLRHFRLTFLYREGLLWAQWQPADPLPEPIPRGFDVNAADFLGLTLLHRAVREGSLKLVERLIRAGAGLQAKDLRGRTPLYLAADRGYGGIAAALIGAGADVDARTRQGETPLMIAAQKGHLATAKALIAGGAKLDARAKNGESPLRLAVARAHADVVKALIQAGADVNAATRKGETPLMIAARDGRETIARALIAGGAKVNARTRIGRTALLTAVMHGRPEMVELLIGARADVRAVNAQGMTALMAAAFYKQTAIAQRLLDAKADVNARDHLHRTALMLAARNGNLPLVQALIRHGADVNAESRTGQSALRLAKANKHTQVVQALIRAGAKP